MSTRAADEAHLAAAVALGRRSLGETWPNPAVGCVIADASGAVAGRGRTRPGGRPHAETEALAAAGGRAAGGTAYVTLEPCSHHGVTPPCADALIAAGIARVVGGARDPDPRVDGRGYARLAAAGVAVEPGRLPGPVEALLGGFRSRIARGRPRVTLKLAASLDGRIALSAGGEDRWLTGPEARRRVHAARAEHDAVMVGIGTALADDPALTVRLDGARTRPVVRVVLDRALRLPPASRLVAAAATDPLWILHGADAPASRAGSLAAAGARLLPHDGTIGDALAALGAAGLNTVFAEGGGRVAAALLGAGLVDTLLWWSAPMLLGAEATASVGPLGLAGFAAAPRFTPVDSGCAAHDMWVSGEREGG